MRTNLQVTAPPASEPVSLALLKSHCRIDSLAEADDTLLAAYLTAARVMAEAYMSRSLINQTLRWTMQPESMSREWHRFWQPFNLPRAPIQSITAVVVTDVARNVTTVPAATLPFLPGGPFIGYVADLALAPCRMTLGKDTVLAGGDTLRHTDIEHITIDMVVGYGPEGADVPVNITQAIMLMAAQLYENRGDAGGETPIAALNLLDISRLQFFGA